MTSGTQRDLEKSMKRMMDAFLVLGHDLTKVADQIGEVCVGISLIWRRHLLYHRVRSRFSLSSRLGHHIADLVARLCPERWLPPIDPSPLA